jgi:hypothetical protein
MILWWREVVVCSLWWRKVLVCGLWRRKNKMSKYDEHFDFGRVYDLLDFCFTNFA